MREVCQYLAERMDLGLSADHLASLELNRRQEWVGHLRTCSACRQAVVGADPTIAFSLLEPDTLGDGEIAEIQVAVKTLRRSRAIETPDKPHTSSGRKAAMAAASLLFALALLLMAGERTPEDASEPVVDVASEQRSRARPGWPQWVEDRTAPPVIEELNRPEARVYQLTEEDLAVVMIVDETLDL